MANKKQKKEESIVEQEKEEERVVDSETEEEEMDTASETGSSDEEDLEMDEADIEDSSDEEEEDEFDEVELKKASKKTKKYSAEAFSDAMTKILASSLTGADKKQPILARSKGVERKIEDEKLDYKAQKILSAQKKAAKEKGRVIPDYTSFEYEKRLRKVATRGVVKLFNAIRTQQKVTEVAVQSVTNKSKTLSAVEKAKDAMTAGNAVLVSRVQAIIPFQYKRIAYIFHWTVTVLRLAIGIVDACVVIITNNPDGSCLYADNRYWGPVYTLYDTVIDVYVTMMISIILISHIRSLAFDDMRINIILYTSVIYNNVIRTVALTIVNLLSAIFIITKNSNEAIMLVWPIINVVFVCLVGYDSDVTKAIRKLRQRHWRQANSSANIDLGSVPSASQPMPKKRPLSREILNDQQSNLHDDLQSSDSSISHTEKYELQKNASTETSTDHTRIGP
ncbi:hypothetical protein G6F68_007108 [Rhizopus microsporus]|nr:hypothetical protein G6F68_007108 [Rhizopus microsporus]